MCTAISLKNKDFYFGRTLDLEYDFGQQVVITPRNHGIETRKYKNHKTTYAIIGMATVVEEKALYAEAINEQGVAIAGLNFPSFCYYHMVDEDKINLTPFEIIPYILGTCKNLSEVKNIIKDLNIIDIAYSDKIPNSPLHWMISDVTGSLVLESMQDGLKIYDNPFGVLTNNPPFDYHMMNMSNYINIKPEQAINNITKEFDLKIMGQGYGAIGLPGDYSPVSRFVKAFFTKTNSISKEDEASNVSQFFHIMDAVSMPSGSVITPQHKLDITRYTCCMNVTKGIYYYTTYNNRQINQISLHNVDLDEKNLYIYALQDKLSINIIV